MIAAQFCIDEHLRPASVANEPLWYATCERHRVTSGWTGREQRRSPRVDVLMRVKGQLAELDAPILVHDLSRTGFSVISHIPFDAGRTLDFRLVGDSGAAAAVTARAVHTRPLPMAPGLHLSGFAFVPGRVTGVLPHVLIDRLIAAVSGPPVRCF